MSYIAFDFFSNMFWLHGNINGFTIQIKIIKKNMSDPYNNKKTIQNY